MAEALAFGLACPLAAAAGSQLIPAAIRAKAITAPRKLGIPTTLLFGSLIYVRPSLLGANPLRSALPNTLFDTRVPVADLLARPPRGPRRPRRVAVPSPA